MPYTSRPQCCKALKMVCFAGSELHFDHPIQKLGLNIWPGLLKALDLVRASLCSIGVIIIWDVFMELLFMVLPWTVKLLLSVCGLLTFSWTHYFILNDNTLNSSSSTGVSEPSKEVLLMGYMSLSLSIPVAARLHPKQHLFSGVGFKGYQQGMQL